jgi:HEAT repeat protein
MDRRILFLLVALTAMSVIPACQQEPLPQLTAVQQTEFQTLRGQLTDLSRTAQTRSEAARLLLAKPYPQARQILRQLLDDSSNPVVQIAIADAIARDGGEQAYIKPLLKMLTGDEPAVRTPAARALVTYQNAGVTDKLVAIAQNRGTDRAVRLVTIEALQRVVAKRCIGALVNLLGDPDPAIRTAAAQSLSRLTNIHSFGTSRRLWKQWWRKNRDKDRVQWLQGMTDGLTRSKMRLERENTHLRERLVKAMEELYNASAKTQRPQIVLAFLRDPQADVRLLGTTLTDKMVAANEKLSPQLRQRVRVMLVDEDSRIRQAAAMLEASLADEKSANLLLNRLRVERQPTVRVGLLAALGHLKRPEALPAVLAEVGSSSDPAATAAAEALGRIASDKPLDASQTAAAAKVLIDRYRQATTTNNDEKLREALLTAMGLVADASAAESLTGALKDQAGIIRLAGVTGLTRLGASEAAGSIQPLVADEDRGVRKAALAGLVKLGGKEYLQAVLERTDSKIEPDPDVRSEALAGVLSLCKSADAKTLEEILRTLKKQADAAVLRIELRQLHVASLKVGKSDGLFEALRALGAELLDAGRPSEAVVAYKEAYELALADDKKPPAAVRKAWFEYVKLLLEANDSTAATVISQYKDAKVRYQAVKLFLGRLAALQKEKDYLAVILLATSAETAGLTRGYEDSQSLTTAVASLLAKARDKQLVLDREQIKKLLPQLLSSDETSHTEAEARIKAVDRRAVRPLLELLRQTVNRPTVDLRAEEAIFNVLKQVAPDLGQYDTSADKAQRLARIAVWLKKS